MRLIQYLLYQGLDQSYLRIYNKCPEALTHFFRANSVDVQLFPPNNHRTNQAEKVIDTWKCHFLSGLSRVEPNFTLHLWCRLLPQAKQTLNLLPISQINHRLSADAQLNGKFDYNRTPMDPPGKKVLIHETPQQRRTWDFHGKEGWYIGTSPLHYQ